MENNDEYNINYEYIPRYIRRTIKQNTGLLREMEIYAKENDVPISRPESMKFIETLLLATNAKRVLEIGAAIGYSAITMAKTGADVTTIERDENMFKPLLENIEKSGLKDKITVLKGDALETLTNMDGQFDFIFIDAAKGQYSEFLSHCLRMLKVGGLIYSDNILYKGMVATDELFKRRKITIIRRLRDYLDNLCHRDDLETSIIPIGDGVALSYKIK